MKFSNGLRPQHRLQSNTVFSWYLSSALVALLPVLITLIVFSYTQTLYKNETVESQRSLLDMISTRVEAELQEAVNLTNDFLISDELSAVKQIREKEINAAIRYQLWDYTSNSFPNIKAHSGTIDEVILYLPQSRLLLSNQLYCSLDKAVSTYFQNSGLDQETLQEMLTTPHKRQLYTMPNAAFGRVMMVTSQYSLSNQLLMNVMVLIHANAIDTVLANTRQLPGSLIFAFDSNGQLIFQNSLSKSQTDLERILPAMETALEKTSASVVLSGANHYTLFAQKQNYLTYVYLVPDTQLYRSTRLAVQSALIAYAVCLVLCFWMIRGIVKRNYMSVSGILEQLSFCNDENAGKDIFATIRRGIDQVHSRYNELLDHVQIISAESGKAAFLRYLSAGSSEDAAAIKAQLEKCGLHWDAPSYALALVRTDQLPDALPLYAARGLIEEQLQEMLMCSVDAEEYSVFLLGLGHPGQYTLLQEKLIDIQFRLDQLHAFVRICLSQRAEGFDELPEAYRYAVQALRNCMLVDEESLIIPTQDHSGLFYHYDTNDEMQLLSAIRKKDQAAVQQILDRILSASSSASSISMCLIFDIASTYIKAAQPLISQDGEAPARLEAMIGSLRACSSMEQTRQVLSQMTEWLCRLEGKIGENRPQYAVQKIKDYIQENIRNPELDNTMIAGACHLNPSYLSTLFKNATGMGLNEYISFSRVELAKQELLSGKRQCQDIAQAVGFSNAMTFNRVFKKYTGQTPGKYTQQ